MKTLKDIFELFNGIIVNDNRPVDEKVVEEINKLTVSKGFILDEKIIYSYNKNFIRDKIIPMIEEYVLSKDQLNKTFHKSWSKIRELRQEDLYIDQILHYITSGKINSRGKLQEYVYYPNETSDLEFDHLPIRNIKSITEKDLSERMQKLLYSGMALNERTSKAIYNIILESDIEIFVDLDKIKNKEFMCMLADEIEEIPKDPVEFVRYLIYKSTSKALLIKSREVIRELNSSTVNCEEIFNKYNDDKKLASIFYRFKPIFLAIKKNANYDLKHRINRIRRLAKKHHKPMKNDYLNDVTSLIKKDKLDITRFKRALKEVNIFRKIRLLNALKYRAQGNKEILYRIRNGKAWATESKVEELSKYTEVAKIVEDIIKNEINDIIGDKKIYIPDNVSYALPSTEKQFIGNIPNMSSIITKKELIFGVYWENYKEHIVDLDLSVLNLHGKVGWNTTYTNTEKTLMFSGDITDAPNGATELFAVVRHQEDDNIVSLNDYTRLSDSNNIPYKLILSEENPHNFDKDYTIDPNKVICSIPMETESNNSNIGLVRTTSDHNKFYFTNFNFGNINISIMDDKSRIARESLINQTNITMLEDVLPKDSIVKNKEECDINLDINELSKEKFLNILTKEGGAQ